MSCVIPAHKKRTPGEAYLHKHGGSLKRFSNKREFFKESRLTTRAWNENELSEDQHTAKITGLSEVFEHDIARIFEEAGLTKEEILVVKMKADEMTFSEIGAALGVSKQRACAIFADIQRLLVAAYNRIGMVSEVYAANCAGPGHHA